MTKTINLKKYIIEYHPKSNIIYEKKSDIIISTKI